MHSLVSAESNVHAAPHRDGRARRTVARLLGLAPAWLIVAGLVVAWTGPLAQPTEALTLGGAPGNVVAWGLNGSNQTTVPLAAQGGIVAVAGGGYSSLALTAGGKVVAWGDDSWHETDVPAGLSGVTAIAAGGFHSLALKSDGTMVAWGENKYGQAAVPVGLSGVVAIAAGEAHSLALKSNGTVVGWGWNGYGQASVPAGLSGVIAIAAGGFHSLALKSNGTVVAWGYNGYGETSIPPGLSGVTAIAAGYGHSLALKADMTVVGWGDNSSGQAAPPIGLSGVVAIGGGYRHSLALKWDGSVVAWGDNADHQRDIPPGTSGVTAISCGMDHSLALQVVYPDSTYHPIAPARVLDTRPTSGVVTHIGLTGPFVAGTVLTFPIVKAHYVGGGSAVAVPDDATAVTGNLTIVGQSADGIVALGPTMTPKGEVTTINFLKGDIRANNVTVALGPNGRLAAVYRSATAGATTQLIFDVTGYFSSDVNGATYHTTTPGRVLDSRPSTGAHANIGLTGKFKTKTVRTFSVAGVKALGWSSALVPASATAVTGNLTVTNATTDGYVAVGPTMVSVPATSTLNTKAGQNRANGVTVALKAGKLQAVWVGKTGSTADIIFDVTGYFTPGLGGQWYHPITPIRLLDSSTGKSLSGSFASKTARNLVVGGMGVIPVGAAGISGNLTLLTPSSAGYGFIAPTIPGAPTSSTLNSTTGLTVANGLDVALSGGKVAIVWVGTTGSHANFQLDITGYWE